MVNISVAGQKTATELNATIMEIDLKHDVMIVAEKEVQLSAYMAKGKKKWGTVFKDDRGNTISAETLKVRDHILVRGEETSAGVIEALEVTKLYSETPFNVKVNKSGVTGIHLEGNVWKN